MIDPSHRHSRERGNGELWAVSGWSVFSVRRSREPMGSMNIGVGMVNRTKMSFSYNLF